MRRCAINLTKLLSIALFLFICMEAPASYHARTDAQMTYFDIKGGASVLRLHVIANSDSDFDQQTKLKVRDALLMRFSPAESLKEAQSILLEQGDGVLETVERVLSREGCAYGAQLRFGTMEFPEKIYGDTIYPAGDYRALRVELGAASGENWWCVLFPPICLLDIGMEDIEGSDELVFESGIAAWRRKNKE